MIAIEGVSDVTLVPKGTVIEMFVPEIFPLIAGLVKANVKIDLVDSKPFTIFGTESSLT